MNPNMSTAGNLVARMLETSASGYAGMATSLLMERHPEIVKRYEPDGFSNWKVQLQRWVLDLSAAIDAGEPRLFENRMLWARSEFDSRKAPLEDLRAALSALRDTLQDKLPEDTASAAIEPIDRAVEAVAGPAAAAETSEPATRSVLSYLKTILEGRPRAAIEQVLETARDQPSVKDAYLHILMPAQRETGRMWHAGELSIAEEHVITSTTQRAMALLCERGRSAVQTDKTVLLACVAGNVHELGIRAISDFFEMAGWHAINLGADVPNDEIARSVARFDADLVVLSATLDPHVRGVARVIERIRALEDHDTKIIVGGPVFNQLPDLWQKVGADGHAARIEDAEPLGSRLTR